MSRTGVFVFGLVAFALCCAPAKQAGAGEEARRGRAAEFSRSLLDGEHERIQGMLSAEMRVALAPAKAKELRARLVARQGDVQEVGRAWKEDVLQGFHRYRVPVRFTGGTLDFRVVLDRRDRVAGLWLVPHLEPPEEAGAAGAAGREIEVTVGGAGRGLPGTLTLPSGGGPFAAVVLVHGSGPNDRDESIGPNKPFRDLAWGLVEHGIAVLRYDKRSFARPGDLAEAGDQLTVRQEIIADARAALELLRSREEIDSARLYVLGHSLGGTVAPRIAAIEPRPAGLIVMAGSTLPMPEKMLAQTRYVVSLDGAVSAEEQQQLEQVDSAVRSIRAALNGTGPSPEGYLLGAPLAYYKDLEMHDPPAEAARLGIPVLVLQGKRDYQVTLEDFALWQVALSDTSGACLVLYDELDHLFRAGQGPSGPDGYTRWAPVESEVIGDIADWLRLGRCPGRLPARSDEGLLDRGGP